MHASFEQAEQSIVRHTCRMEQPSVDTPRVATVPEAATVARLLDTFNRDYDTPTPGTAVLSTRLGRLLAGGDVIALLTGDPAVAVALLTLRPNADFHAAGSPQASVERAWRLVACRMVVGIQRSWSILWRSSC